jgi:hypothetical protein
MDDHRRLLDILAKHQIDIIDEDQYRIKYVGVRKCYIVQYSDTILMDAVAREIMIYYRSKYHWVFVDMSISMFWNLRTQSDNICRDLIDYRLDVYAGKIIDYGRKNAMSNEDFAVHMLLNCFTELWMTLACIRRYVQNDANSYKYIDIIIAALSLIKAHYARIAVTIEMYLAKYIMLPICNMTIKRRRVNTFLEINMTNAMWIRRYTTVQNQDRVMLARERALCAPILWYLRSYMNETRACMRETRACMNNNRKNAGALYGILHAYLAAYHYNNIEIGAIVRGNIQHHLGSQFYYLRTAHAYL